MRAKKPAKITGILLGLTAIFLLLTRFAGGVGPCAGPGLLPFIAAALCGFGAIVFALITLCSLVAHYLLKPE